MKKINLVKHIIKVVLFFHLALKDNVDSNLKHIMFYI